MTKRGVEFAALQVLPSEAVPFAKRRCTSNASRAVTGVLSTGPQDMPGMASSPQPLQDSCVRYFEHSRNQGDIQQAVSSHHLTQEHETIYHQPTAGQQHAFAGGAGAEQQLPNGYTAQTNTQAIDVHNLNVDEAQQFLSQLASGLRVDLVGSALSGSTAEALGGFGADIWRAVCELNVLMGRHFSGLPASSLRGYHSFTRAPPAELWARLAHAYGAQPGQEASFGLSAGPLHMRMARWLLEALHRQLAASGFGASAAAAHAYVSCVSYTVALPAWLAQWCARWGHAAPGGQVRFLALVPYAAGDAGGTVAMPTVYLPYCE